ncbi:MAG TPA: hypothetical protein VFR59_01120, partial [Steroidobacteraceae bacterium]|nr:hypothetical protein [Steroidobacteraceae bacterium]
MLQRRVSATLVAAILQSSIVLAANAAQPVDQGHSLEADLQDERDSQVEGLAARLMAQQPVGWRDESAANDPVVRVKLLGFNDFHGQISAGRRVANRP